MATRTVKPAHAVRETISEPEFLARARALVPILRERAFEAERNRRLHQETIDELVGSGVLQMLGPHRFGGGQAALSTFFETAAILGEGDGSAAWLFGILGCHHWVLAHFDLQAQEDIYAGQSHAFFPLTFSGKGGTATKVDGGYRVSGDWSFASGIDFSDWVGAIALTEQNDPNSALNVLMRRPEVEVIDDWFVAGMRATGSRRFSAEGVFVPEHRTLSQRLIMSGRTPGAAALQEYMGLRIPLHTVLIASAVGALFGLTRRAIDEFVALTKNRVGYGGINHAVRASTQIRIADAMARCDAYFNLIRMNFQNADLKASEGRTPNAEEKLRTRRDAALAAAECVQIIDSIVGAAGARAQHESSPFQMIQRDAHTVCTHVVLDRDDANELYGRHVLGLDLGTTRF